MADLNISNTTYTNMASTVTNYSVDPMQTDGIEDQNETYYDNNDANKFFGYYKKIPELKKAIDALAMWVVGKGYATEDIRTEVLLEAVRGWGEDSFEAILNNLMICKKVYGDAFAEIIRDEKTNTLLNLKVLDPASIRIVADEKGIIKRYEQKSKTGKKQATKIFKPKDILHLCNDRVADEIHGTSVIEACEWVILARNEAMNDWKNILHRNMHFRYLEVDEDNATKLAAIKTQYSEAIKRGELLILPKGTAEFKTLVPSVLDPQAWIRYLENFFYNAVGIPKVVLGGSEEFTESSAKVGYLTFEQVYSKEQRELEADLWNQCQIKIIFNKPASLKNEMLSSENKNTGQVNFQPSDVQVGMGARQ